MTTPETVASWILDGLIVFAAIVGAMAILYVLFGDVFSSPEDDSKS